MKTIAFANLKGGVGKSTLAVHLAWYLAESGYPTLLIDLDPQGNSSSTLRAHGVGVGASLLFDEAALPAMPELVDRLGLIDADNKLKDIARADAFVMGTFAEHVAALGASFDYCVIDTSPSVDRRTESALMAADYFITPVDVETYAVEGLGKFLQEARRVLTFKERYGQKLEFLGVIANKVNNTSPMHLRNLRELIAEYPQFIIPHKVSARTNIGEAIAERKPVWSLPKTAARDAGKELRVVLGFIAQRLGAKTKEAT